jgi:hypothetical protein
MSEDFRPYETPATWNGHEGKLYWTSPLMWVFEWDTKNGSQNVSVIDDYGEMPQTTCTERLKENCIGVQTIFGETAKRLWQDVIKRRTEEVRQARGENNSRPRIEHWLHQSPPQSNSMDREDDDHEKRDGGSRRRKSKQRKSRKSNQSKKRKSKKNNRRRR